MHAHVSQTGTAHLQIVKMVKSDGNKQQFQHKLNVLGKMEGAFSALDQHKYDKAKQALSEGIELVKFRLKLIRIADKSEVGRLSTNT